MVWENGNGNGKTKGFYLEDNLLTALAFQMSALEPKSTVYLRVITEVYYARALDVSIFSSANFGMRAQLRQDEETEEEPVDPGAPPAPIDTASAGSASAAGSLRRLEERLGRTQTVPGGSVQLVSYNERSVGLRRVFDRPVAIGFRGLMLAVSLKDGKVTVTTIAGPGSPLLSGE